MVRRSSRLFVLRAARFLVLIQLSCENTLSTVPFDAGREKEEWQGSRCWTTQSC